MERLRKRLPALASLDTLSSLTAIPTDKMIIHPVTFPRPTIRGASRSSLRHLLLCGALLGVSGCGQEPETESAPAQPAGAGKAVSAESADHRVAEEAPLDHPATVAEAAQRLDLTTFPLIDGAPEGSQRSIGHLLYRVQSDLKAAFEFQRKHLLALNWSESPGASVTEQYANGTYTRAGFRLSVMVVPTDQPGKVDVMLHNQGNVDLAKLPLPSGATVEVNNPGILMVATAAPVAAAREEMSQGLAAAGWQPFGQWANTLSFRKNAVLLEVSANSAPDPGGKTAITIQSQQMSAELPPMPGAEQIRYEDPPSRLGFFTAAGDEEVSQFYRQALLESGWQATMESILKTDGKGEVFFVNAAKDLLTLEMKAGANAEGKLQTQVTLRHQPAVVVAEQEKREKAQIEKARQKHLEEQKSQAAP